MPQQDLSHWLGLSIVFKNKTDLTTETLDFTNKPYLIGDPNLYDSSVYPLIISGTKMGTVSDGQSVLPDSGSIRLLNSIGSFGVDRKLSDILERYEIVDQQATLTYGTSDIEALVPETSVTGYLLKVLDWTHVIDQDEPAIEIRLDSRKIPKRIINRKIDSTIFSNAPLSSISKNIPIVFGSDVQVKPVYIGTTQWAYATTLAAEHAVGGVQTIYAKDADGDYQTITNPATTSTALYQFSCSGASAGLLSAASYGFTLGAPSSTCYILRGGKTLIDGGSTPGTPTGKLEFKLVEYNIATGAPDESRTVASAAVNKSDYTSGYNGSADFYVEFSFNKPAVLRPNISYILLISGSDEVAYPTALVLGNTGGSGLWNRVTSTSGLGWNTSNTSGGTTMEFYGVVFTDTTSNPALTDSSGGGAAYVTADQKTAATGQTNPELSKLDLIFAINGLRDDSGGTITGSANSQITTIHHAIKLMSQTYNGSTWELDTNNWDFTTYADTYFSTNTISGCTDGEFTLEQWLRQACRNSATKLVMLSNGKLAPYSWGTTRTSAATFDQENSKLIRFETSDASYVINGATIACGRGLIYYDSLIAASQGIASDYTLVYRFDSAYSAEYTTLIGTSESLYGARELADIYFNWIGSLSTAERAARHLLTNFNQPVRYVEVEAPYNEFATLEPMAVVTIINPSLPNYYGGIPNAKLPHYLGDEVDPIAGYNLCEAQSYRAQIEGKTLTYNEDSAPTLNLICRLLTNYPNDPT